MAVPEQPKIYHIIHVDRLASVVSDGHLWCDAEVIRRQSNGTTIGMDEIKQRRLRTTLTSHPDLHVGDCVPFYFCPRSIMLVVIYYRNHESLRYRDGQRPIVHLEADLRKTVAWAEANDKRWAFTLTNAGSNWFEDLADLGRLDELNWNAIRATDFRPRDIREGKQAEFLIEHGFPWHLVERIGVHNSAIARLASNAISVGSSPLPPVEVMRGWYF